MDTLQAIITHGLSVRQVPRSLTSLHDPRHKQEGDTDVEHPVPEANLSYVLAKHANSPSFRIEGDKAWRLYVRRVTTPKHAGFWMCQQVNNTSSRVEWSSKTCHLAPTLEESVGLFLASLK